MAGEVDNLGNILDSITYNGKFLTYHHIQEYYTSMGGGSLDINNRTVRMRIYPRMKNKEKIEYLALISQDDNLDSK